MVEIMLLLEVEEQEDEEVEQEVMVEYYSEYTLL